MLRECVSDWFQRDDDSPYMNVVLRFKDEKIKEVTEALSEAQSFFGKDDHRAPAYEAAMLKEEASTLKAQAENI